MTYTVQIGGVDGETQASITTKDPQYALDFLQRYDHEGSSIGVRLDADTPDEAFSILFSQIPVKSGH